MANELANLLRIGKIKAEPPNARELAGLLTSGDRRLTDARRVDLAFDSRFDLAYNAAHSLCLAALRYRGYRPKNRYIVFQVLPHTLGLGAEVWRVLAKCHDLRNKGEYEGELDIDDRIVTDLIAACGAVAKALETLKPL